MSEYKKDKVEEEEFSLSEELVLSSPTSSRKLSDDDKKKKKKFKPRKFISKLIKKDDQSKIDPKPKEKEEEKVSSPKFDSFKRSFVKRFSRRKNYKVSPMQSEEQEEEDGPLNAEFSQISKSDPNICNNSIEDSDIKINEDSLELSKSMQTVDKSSSIYTTTHQSLSSSSFKKENKRVQLQITISGKKVEKVSSSASQIITTSTKTIASENEVDKVSPVQQQPPQYKSRTDIVLPSTSTTTVLVNTSSSSANMHVPQQTKSICTSVPHLATVKEGHVTSSVSSVSEREIEKYLALTSDLNTIISSAKDFDQFNNSPPVLDASKNLTFPKTFREPKIYDTPIETDIKVQPSEMKKSQIPVSKRRSSSQEVPELEHQTATVHTQEAHKPYNLTLSTSTSGEDFAKEKDATVAPSVLSSTTHSTNAELKAEVIKFELGTPVRPPKILQPTPIHPIADIIITEADFSSSMKDLESADDVFHTPKGESSITIAKKEETRKTRRKIAYIPELSIYTPEEQELLKSNISANNHESFDAASLPPDSSIFPVFDDSSVSSMTPTTPEKRECLYKILVIGELGTGKTSFIKRYVHQFFSQNYRATIGVDFALKVLSWDESTIIRLQLWDIAGQERFGNMTRVYFKEAVGAFIVFDVTRTATFDAVNKWKQDLDSKVQLPDGSPIPCILLANKCDQQKQGLVTMPAKMDEYCKQHGFAGWFETSAKDNTNIEESAKALVSKILLNDKLIHSDMLDGDRLVLDAEDLNKPKKFCSC